MGNPTGRPYVDVGGLEVEFEKNVSASLGDEAKGLRSAVRNYGSSPRNVIVRVYDLAESRQPSEDGPKK